MVSVVTIMWLIPSALLAPVQLTSNQTILGSDPWCGFAAAVRCSGPAPGSFLLPEQTPLYSASLDPKGG